MLLFCLLFSMKVGPLGQLPSWRENDLYRWRTSSKQQFLAYTIVTNTSIYIDCVRIPFGIVQRQQIKMLIRFVPPVGLSFPFCCFPEMRKDCPRESRILKNPNVLPPTKPNIINQSCLLRPRIFKMMIIKVESTQFPLPLLRRLRFLCTSSTDP